MKYIALLVCSSLIVGNLSASDSSEPWHASWMLEAVGVGAVLVFVLILWGLRKVAATFIHIVVLLVAAALLLLALFGRSLGLYDALLGTSYAGNDAPLSRLNSQAHHEEVERDDPNAPSFEEFFRDNPE